MNRPVVKACLLVLGTRINYDNRVWRHVELLRKLNIKPILFVQDKDYSPPKPIRKSKQKTEIIYLPKDIVGFKPGLFPRVVNFFKSFFYIDKLSKLLIAEKAQVYIANDLPTLEFCTKAAQKSRARLVYDSHEFFLETIRTKISNSRGLQEKASNLLFYIASSFKERFYIKKADLVVAVNQSLANIFKKKYGLKKTLVVRNIFEYQKVKRRQKFHKKFNLPANNKIILYQGKVKPGRGIEVMIKALKFLPKNYVAVIMGHLTDGGYLEYARKMSLGKRVFYHPAVSRKHLLSFTASADVGNVLIEGSSQDIDKFFTLPNKFFEFIMAGVPVIASDLPELRKIIKKYQVGELVKNYRDAKGVARVIKKLTKPTHWRDMRKNCLQTAKTKYNWREESKNLVVEYEHFFPV